MTREVARPGQAASRVPAILAGLILAAPASGRSADVDLLTNRFYVAVGTFVVSTDTTVELDGATSRGTDVDLERTFGDDSATRVVVEGAWRFASRHRIRALVFQATADRSRVVDRDVTWGDEVYPAGTEVSLERHFEVYQVAYDYSFLHRENWELSASAGLHWTALRISLDAQVGVDGQPGATRTASESGSLDMPLPVVGLRGLWNPGRAFWLDASAQWFSLSYDGYDGNLTDLRLTGTWQPKTWFGVGLGYNVFWVNLDVDKERFQGSLQWQYGGPMLFLSGSF